MTSKQNILDGIRKNVSHDIEMPDIDVIVPVQYEGPLSKFVEMVEFVGGHAVMLELGEDINDAIRRNYPEAKVVASSLPYIKADSCVRYHFDKHGVNHLDSHPDLSAMSSPNHG